MSVLFSWLSIPRWICIWIDGIAFSLIDQFYNIIVDFSKGTLLKQDYVLQLMQNIYIVIGIFALFRLALLLVNAIINPDKLTEEGKGISKIAANILIMFVLLITVPIIFREALYLQDKVVSGNYIQKIFLKNADIGNKKNNPGKTMQAITISALIRVDDKIWEDSKQSDNYTSKNYEVVGACTSNCKKAVEEWLKEKESGYFEITKLSNHIGTSVKVDGETVYVYHYYVVVTLIVAVLILWVLGSFAFEIAMRMVELTVLQVLSPLFIATIVDPKSMKSGPFNNWLKAVGKSYASLFIRLAILSLMLLFVQIIGNLDNYSDLKLDIFEKVVLLIAILMFAKKAPNWITSMIGIGDANGMGLLTPKKIKENMAGLGAMRTAAAAGGAYVGNRLANYRNNRLKRRDARKASNAEIEANPNMTNKEKRAIRRKNRKDLDATVPKAFARNIVGAANALRNGAKAGKGANSLKDALSAAADVTANFKDAKGLSVNGPGVFGKLGKSVKGAVHGASTAIWGSDADIFDAQKKAKKQEKLDNFYTSKAIKDNNMEIDKAILGAGDIEKLGEKPRDFGDLMAMSYAKAIGGSASYDANGNLVVKGADGTTISTQDAIKAGRNMYTDEGIANMHQVYNSFQQNSLSEQASNAQLMNQLTSSISAMSDQLGNLRINNLTNNELTLGDGTRIALDKKSIDSLTDAQRQLQEKVDSERVPSRKAEYQKSLNEVTQYIQHFDEISVLETQRESAVTELSSLQARQVELNAISEGIKVEWKDKDGEFISESKDFVTTEQKQQYLATKADDYSKEVKFAEEQRKKKKGESDK